MRKVKPARGVKEGNDGGEKSEKEQSLTKKQRELLMTRGRSG